ncbi:GAF and ANTAR domain-containing protein [Arthrobacter sp. ISL-85]|uniref:GAF and ANTAR domain-containing protein n=1 Tax=Arthrobacter sp. ISL-85 TaxID=2819115 RepID=UPI001BEAECFC|nr:GAF and ANTAR domain-containing protein [Arthrobacter sp. ISL-85]MBT2565281.1 GAF and ANTAR domain-containing protein [Arthrobacter sp. ISL-85]
MDNSLPLTNEFAALAGDLTAGFLSEESASKAVQSLAYALKDSVPNAAGAGASLINARGRRESAGATDPVVLRADKLQYELGQGPCLSAWAEQRPIIIQDTRQETRWPQWTAAVADLPIRSVLSAPLTTEGRRIGAIKVYSPSPLAFDDHSVFLIERLAVPAAVMLGNVRDREAMQRTSSQLADALAHRDVISRAQGVLIERKHISSSEALNSMLSASRKEEKPLHVVAREIVSGTTNK